MTVLGLLARFFIFYILLILTIGTALNYLGINGGSAVNLGILLFLIFWLCESYGKKNNRFFTGKEKSAVVIGMIIIDVILQIVFATVAIAQREVSLGAEALIIGMGITVIIHSIMIYIFVGVTKKLLIKKELISG